MKKYRLLIILVVGIMYFFSRKNKNVESVQEAQVRSVPNVVIKKEYKQTENSQLHPSRTDSQLNEQINSLTQTLNQADQIRIKLLKILTLF